MSSRPSSATPPSIAAATAVASRNVGLGSGDAAAELPDLRDGLVEVLGSCERVVDRADIGADVDRDDVGAVSRKAHRVGATLPSSGAADNRDFAVQQTHQGFSPTARHHRG